MGGPGKKFPNSPSASRPGEAASRQKVGGSLMGPARRLRSTWQLPSGARPRRTGRGVISPAVASVPFRIQCPRQRAPSWSTTVKTILFLFTLLAAAASPASGQFVDGHIFVTDWTTDRIYEVDPVGWTYTAFADASDGISGPSGLGFSSQGQLLTSNYHLSNVMEFDATGNGSIVLDAGDGLNGPWGENGIAIDSQQPSLCRQSTSAARSCVSTRTIPVEDRVRGLHRRHPCTPMGSASSPTAICLSPIDREAERSCASIPPAGPRPGTRFLARTASAS